METGSPLTKRAFFIWLLLLSAAMLSAQDMYWVGGPGDWNDLSHWAKASGSSDLTGRIPDATTRVFIDDGSGLNAGATITISPGDYAVRDLTVTASRGFTLSLLGTSPSQDVEFNAFGDLVLNPQMVITYASTNISYNT